MNTTDGVQQSHHAPLKQAIAPDHIQGRAAQGGWPELTAVVVTAAMQWRLKHPLLSILCGTTLYVVWRNGAFG